MLNLLLRSMLPTSLNNYFTKAKKPRFFTLLAFSSGVMASSICFISFAFALWEFFFRC